MTTQSHHFQSTLRNIRRHFIESAFIRAYCNAKRWLFLTVSQEVNEAHTTGACESVHSKIKCTQCN